MRGTAWATRAPAPPPRSGAAALWSGLAARAGPPHARRRLPLLAFAAAGAALWLLA